jgi:hypothetical protein
MNHGYMALGLRYKGNKCLEDSYKAKESKDFIGVVHGVSKGRGNKSCFVTQAQLLRPDKELNVMSKEGELFLSYRHSSESLS